jgi:hypothetical protein
MYYFSPVNMNDERITHYTSQISLIAICYFFLSLFRTLSYWWHMNNSSIEHVRIVIDQNQESDQNNNPTSFVIVSFNDIDFTTKRLYLSSVK